MSDTHNSMKNAAVKRKNAYDLTHEIPKQLTVGWHCAARLSEGDPLYIQWQHSSKTRRRDPASLSEDHPNYTAWQDSIKAGAYAYDWTRPVTQPDDWTGTKKAWGVFARRTVRRLKNPKTESNLFSEDEWTAHHQHVRDSVRVLRRHGLLPDWAVHDPLAPIPKRIWTATRKLWAANDGRVWLAVLPLDCPTRLNVTADVQRLFKHGKAVLKALSGGTRAWGAVEVTPIGLETIYDHETDSTDEILHGTREHMGLTAGAGADLSACTYVRQARSIWDVVFWLHYHDAGYDSRLKVKVVPSKKGAVGAVKKGSRWFTLYVPHDFSLNAVLVVSDGLAVRAGLQAAGRKNLNAQTFTVNTGAGRRTKAQHSIEIEALELVPDGAELAQYNTCNIDALSPVPSADRRAAPRSGAEGTAQVIIVMFGSPVEAFNIASFYSDSPSLLYYQSHANQISCYRSGGFDPGSLFSGSPNPNSPGVCSCFRSSGHGRPRFSWYFDG